MVLLGFLGFFAAVSDNRAKIRHLAVLSRKLGQSTIGRSTKVDRINNQSLFATLHFNTTVTTPTPTPPTTQH
jgi:hypothetical protein